METKEHSYAEGDTTFNGFLAYENKSLKRPVVLVAHDWGGCNEFARTKAKKLAGLGYVGFAIDMFGNGQIGKTKEEKMALIQPLMTDRNKLFQRINAAYQAALQLEMADAKQIAAIGFCFGGLCVLDLARGGSEVQGVVSFHGLLNSPPDQTVKQISAKVLVLHGYDDPMAPPEQVNQLAQEMTLAQADWQIHLYGHTKHAFANPEANDLDLGTVYNKGAAERSWLSMRNFLSEVFGN